jgi:two-component system phosphate regulon sensor histidine kinase PhoR
MAARFWLYALALVSLALTGAVMAALGSAPWRIFLALALIGLLFAVLAEALRNPPVPVAADAAAGLPAGFGRALLEQMPTALLVIDRKGRLSYANPAAWSMVPRLQTGTHFANLFRAPGFVAAVNATIADGSVNRVEFPSGSAPERWFAAQIGPVPQGGDFGEGVDVIIQVEDRTDSHRVDDLRRDFIANASHELRTPLAAVLGYIETLRGAAKDDAGVRDKFLGIMFDQADRMRRLVEDLMSLSRIEMNEHQRPSDLVVPGRIAAECVAALQPLAERQGAVIEMHDLDLISQAKGDRDQLVQVFTNLIENAIKYGGAKPLVRLGLAKPDDRYPRMAGITVADNGGGIPREHLHRLTERFYRVNVKQSREKGGTGLGLAIVKHILTRHGGEIEIDSSLGAGSRFTVWLPLARNDDESE